MKRINFVNPEKEIYSLLVYCWAAQLPFAQTACLLADKGYYLPRDQYKSFKRLLDIDLALNIGLRQNEGRN